MIDIQNILRLAGDGYDVHDIRKFTRVPVPTIRQICQEGRVELRDATERPKPVVVVKSVRRDADTRHHLKSGPTTQKEPPLPKVKENPILFAGRWLGARLTERPGVYLLDGTPARLDEIMRAANRAAKKAGAEQCLHSDAWRP